jgi:hypothetical protein
MLSLIMFASPVVIFTVSEDVVPCPEDTEIRPDDVDADIPVDTAISPDAEDADEEADVTVTSSDDDTAMTPLFVADVPLTLS